MLWAKIRYQEKIPFQRDFFLVHLFLWTRACGVWSNISALVPDETSASLVGSTEKPLFVKVAFLWLVAMREYREES